MIFHSPKLSTYDLGFFRTPGPGLGNLLFPLARAVIARESKGGELVYPTFRQLKFGTYLRREGDKRTYGMVFRPRTSRDWVIWYKSKSVSSYLEHENVAIDNATIHYSGLGSCFHDIAGTDNREVVAKWLEKNMRPRGKVFEHYDLAVHIRRGDFSVSQNMHANGRNFQLPISWYRDAIEYACELMGEPTPSIVLHTDGNAEEIARQLQRSNTTVFQSANAMHSIESMSKAAMLVASNSSFSMWGSFLGNAPTIWNSEFDLARDFPPRPEVDLFL